MAAVQKHPFLAILSSSMVITHHLAFEFQEWWCWEAQVATRMVLKPKKRTSVSTRHLGSYSHPHNELLRKKQHMSLLPIEGPICFKRLCGSNQGSKLVRHWNFTFTSFLKSIWDLFDETRDHVQSVSRSFNEQINKMYHLIVPVVLSLISLHVLYCYGGHYISIPNNALLIKLYNGKSFKFTIQLHCLIPIKNPKMGNLITSIPVLFDHLRRLETRQFSHRQWNQQGVAAG